MTTMRSRFLVSIGLSALLGASSSRAEPPLLGPLRFFPGDTATGAALNDQTAAAIARGGDGFLVVWSDSRARLGTPDIWGLRLDAAGNALDAASFVIGQDAGSQANPKVAWNGVHWLVTWVSQDATTSYYRYVIHAARVSAAGEVLDDPSIVVSASGDGAGLEYALASDGSNWTVIWQGSSAGNTDTRGCRIGPDGTLLDPAGVVIVPGASFLRSGFSLAWSKDRYLFVWTEWTSTGQDDIFETRLTSALGKLDPSPVKLIATTNYDVNPEVEGNGNEFYLVWEQRDQTSSIVDEVDGTRVNLAGQARDGVVKISGRTGYGNTPDVAWDGTQWIVAWINPGVWAARVRANGSVIDAGGFPVDASSSPSGKAAPAIAGAASGGAQVAWHAFANNAYDLYRASVSAAGSAGPSAVTGLAALDQSGSRAVWNGNGYAVAFLSQHAGVARVKVQRTDASGNAIDLEPVEVAAGHLSSPGIAWSGLRYLVTWRNADTGGIEAVRLGPDLGRQDPAPIAVFVGSEPAVAAQGDLFLVVGTDMYPNRPEIRLTYGVRLRGSDGVVLGPRFSIGESFAISPTVAAVGARWLATWEAHPTHDDPHCSILAAFVDTAGFASSSFGVSGGGLYNNAPAVAGSADMGLVVWQDSTSGANDRGITASRVRADGTRLDYPAGLVLSNAPGNQSLPAAGWDGAEFVVLWQDPRANAVFFDNRTDLYGARVSVDGALPDPGGFAVFSETVPEVQPAVAGANGNALLVGSVLRPVPLLGSFRIGTRWLQAIPAPIAPVSGLHFTAPADMGWNIAGGAAAYDVLRGILSALQANGSVGDAVCIDEDIPATGCSDAASPSAGDGYYYLVRGDHSGGAPGTYDDPVAGGQQKSRDPEIGTLGGTPCTHLP